MNAPVNLYDNHYDRFDEEVYRAIRRETYGEDLGQSSWITAEECRRFCERLGIRAEHRVLEVACGSGGVATRIAETTGAEVVGIDVNAFAIGAAQSKVTAPNAGTRLEFLVVDANGASPFPDASFDIVFCNDSINHFRNRLEVLRDWKRILRAGGRCLFTDPVVVTGLLSNAEMAARSSIGFFLFSAPGVNEVLLPQAGFRVLDTVDVTEGVVQTSSRWRDARESRRSALIELEGESKFGDLQKFLDSVHTLAKERRLSRIAFVGQRVENDV